jgi:SAM-dependent methyltransferase
MNHKLIGRIYSGEEITWRSRQILPDLEIGFCEICGFYHAHPYPSDQFLADYYRSYQMLCPLHNEERDRIARLLLSRVRTSDTVIDIGCGKGEMLATLLAYGFRNLYGAEYGSMIEDSRKLESITILPYDIAGLCEWSEAESKTFDCAILINVFEHVPEPIDLIMQIRKILSPGGMLMFVVPNDFNMLQKVYLEKTKGKPWFLILPDHVNFFSLETIDGVMQKAGYEIIHRTVQYPLEFFLLQGDDYVATPEIGRSCHNKRVIFEKAFRETGRDKEFEQLYEGLAKIGIGRDMYIFAKPT